MRMAGITTKYAMPHERNQTLRNLSLKPMFIEISVKDIIPVVTIPIIIAKAILFFIRQRCDRKSARDDDKC